MMTMVYAWHRRDMPDLRFWQVTEEPGQATTGRGGRRKRMRREKLARRTVRHEDRGQHVVSFADFCSQWDEVF